MSKRKSAVQSPVRRLMELDRVVSPISLNMTPTGLFVVWLALRDTALREAMQPNLAKGMTEIADMLQDLLEDMDADLIPEAFRDR